MELVGSFSRDNIHGLWNPLTLSDFPSGNCIEGPSGSGRSLSHPFSSHASHAIQQSRDRHILRG